VLINIIVAIDKFGGIGKENTIPWKLNKDMRTFKKLTKNSCVVMGRKTYESIGKPLPYRTNMVLTKNKNYHNDYVFILNDVSEVLDVAKETGQDLFVCGGGMIYKSFMPLADRLYITMVDCSCDCDAKFVYDQKFIYNLDGKLGWKFNKIIFEQDVDEKNEYKSKMFLYERTN